ncbi:butyrophilin subfamily 2 member A1-like [Perca flavescens]|uniref:butyrophilin subfamily 2 member A1-like n=1 Tax=Perca flavescens TaxID=8167 RepID=UPI00106E46C8|nr:butyrophilin subfamily 2 member A1-like [Perca flavescens]
MKTFIFLLLTSLLFAETTLGGFLLSDLNQTVEAEEGHDVILQGRLDPPVDLSSYTFDVARLDLGIYGDVYSYRRGEDHLDDQMDRYRDRTTLNHEDLIRGIVTLKISSVTLSDSGPYKVYVPDLTDSFIVNIIVVPKGQLSEMKRNAQASTRPPATSPEGENEKAARAHIVPIVLLILVAVIGVIIVLVKGGIMQNYMRQFRERRNHQAQTTQETTSK